MTLIETHAEVADHAAAIAKLFKPGAKVSILIRNPNVAGKEPHSADMVVSDDDMGQVIESIEYLRKREERVLSEGQA